MAKRKPKADRTKLLIIVCLLGILAIQVYQSIRPEKVSCATILLPPDGAVTECVVL